MAAGLWAMKDEVENAECSGGLVGENEGRLGRLERATGCFVEGARPDERRWGEWKAAKDCGNGNGD